MITVWKYVVMSWTGMIRSWIWLMQISAEEGNDNNDENTHSQKQSPAVDYIKFLRYSSWIIQGLKVIEIKVKIHRKWICLMSRLLHIDNNSTHYLFLLVAFLQYTKSYLRRLWHNNGLDIDVCFLGALKAAPKLSGLKHSFMTSQAPQASRCSISLDWMRWTWLLLLPCPWSVWSQGWLDHADCHYDESSLVYFLIHSFIQNDRSVCSVSASEDEGQTLRCQDFCWLQFCSSHVAPDTQPSQKSVWKALLQDVMGSSHQSTGLRGPFGVPRKNKA